jgi:hypothetical protein
MNRLFQPNTLEKISDSYYKSSEGYYMYENYKWIFMPFEKSLDSDQLKNILLLLEYLNDNTKYNR